ncbi:hypothetical protein D3C76_818250 [compost metagenome]
MALHVVGAGGEVEHLGARLAQPVGQCLRGNFLGLRLVRDWCLPVAAGAEVVAGNLIQHGHLPTHLCQPGRAHVGANAVVVHQHQPRAAHAGEMVGFLHQLASRSRARTGQMAGRVLLGSTHIEQIGGARGVFLPLAQSIKVDACYAGSVGHGAGADGCLLARLLADFTEAPRLAVLQLLAGQGPADGAVAQCGHRIGGASVDQRLGADKAAGASGAVDDHSRGRVRR